MPVTKENVMKYTLRNKNGFEVSLISFGAIIQSILVADKNNQRLNIALGFDVFDGIDHRI
jgi:aldose 1-epimerase